MLSVVIPTRDRAAGLPACLEHVATAAAQLTDAPELIVVDNRSTDDTARVIREFGCRAAFPVHYLLEPRPGSSSARNAGILSATGSLIALTDDDCLVAPNWLAVIADRFAADPELALLGGRVDLADPADHRVSIRPFADSCEIRGFSDLSHYMIGCNMAVRRSVLDRIGLFDRRLGAGTPSGSCEDFDLFYRIVSVGLKVRYDAAVKLRHAHGRRDHEVVAALARGYVRGRGAFYAKHMVRGDLQILRHCYWEIRGLLRDDPAGNAAVIRGLFGGMMCRLTGR